MKTHHLLIRWVGAVCLLALAVGSAGCEIPTGELPTCVWGDPMPAYEMVSPADWSTIDDLTPTLTWRLRGEASCLPAEYKIQIQSAMLYPLGASAGYLVFSGRSTTQSLVWPDDADPLLPGHTYYVYIINMVDHDGELAPAGETGFGYFNTGPLCGAADRLSAPSLRWPPNGWTVDPSTTITLEWDSTMACWPTDDWTVQISLTESFTHPFEFEGYPMEGVWIHSFFAADLGITNCTRVYWRARPNMAGVGDAYFSEIWSFIAQTPDVICPVDLGPRITPMPVVTLPPGESSPPGPLAKIIEDAACWSGPSMEYVVVDYLTPGQELPIHGRDQGNSWWYVVDPAINKACWVYGERVEASGDLTQVPIQPAPPVPTRTPTTPPSLSCDQYSDSTSCSNNQACWWDSNAPPNGVCKNK